jgi:hypothetical protein
MKLWRQLAVAAAVPVVAVGLGAASGLASAANAAPAAPSVSHSGEAGYEAAELNTNTSYLTHITAYLGLGNPQYGAQNPQLPIAPASVVSELAGSPTGVSETISGVFLLPTAARVGLDDGNGGYDVADAALIRVSSSDYDLIGVFGTGATAVNGEATVTAGHYAVLLRNISDAHTAELDVLYDGRNNYDGHLAGSATFYARDLSAKHLTTDTVNLAGNGNFGKEFFHGVAGVVNSPATVTTLGTTVPVPGTQSQIYVLFAHTFLNGNNIGGSEFFGTLQSGADWTVVPDVFENHAGAVERGPGVFDDDHFSVYSGV